MFLMCSLQWLKIKLLSEDPDHIFLRMTFQVSAHLFFHLLFSLFQQHWSSLTPSKNLPSFHPQHGHRLFLCLEYSPSPISPISRSKGLSNLVVHLQYLTQGQTSPSQRKSTLNSHLKDRCWSWSSNVWPPDWKIQATGKDSGARKDWGQKEKGVTEN